MLDINIWEIVLYIVNLLILFFVLRKLLYKPIAKFLSNRTEAIRKQVDDAARKQAEAEKMKAKYDEMLADAQGLSAQIISDGRKLADEQARQIIDEAAEQAREMRERASKQIEEEKQRAVLEMRQEITNIAVQIAQKILRREVSRADNQEIIDSFFKKVG